MIGIDKFRAFEALQIPNTQGSWRNIISEAQNMITRYQKIEWEALRPRYYTQQAQVDQATQLAFKNQQYDCAAICHRLLKSNYVAIVAQAHVLLARLRDTPDKTEHCELAWPRLLRLVTEATEQAGLWTDLLDVINRIATPRPWFRPDTGIGAPMESQQWEWIRTAQRLVRNDGRFNEIDEGLAAFRVLSDSSYPGIRAFCHLQLSTNTRAGDFLYRRLEAWAVIEDLQVLRDTFSNDDRWTRFYVEAMQVLSGNVEDQWVQWGQGMPLDDVLNFVAGSNKDTGPDPNYDSERMDID
ncbi:hypothetical protein B0O99DRAFT_633009 [Bisporella sp. PMI_857]|nr:hypothetical protein B0O99DRAFT_633009 [Bisporella sp. PMI_857]